MGAVKSMIPEDELNDQWLGGSTNIRPTYYAKYKIDHKLNRLLDRG